MLRNKFNSNQEIDIYHKLLMRFNILYDFLLKYNDQGYKQV